MVIRNASQFWPLPLVAAWLALSAFTAAQAQEPAARILHSSVWTGTEMIVWGGVTTTAQQTGARFNPTTGVWQSTTTNGAPVARYNHMAVWAGNRMMVYGGFGANGESVAGGAAYDPETDAWTPLPAGNPPGACHDSAIAWTGTELLIWGGGRFQSGFNFLLGSGARLNPNGGSWATLSTTNAPLARSATKSLWTGSELLVWGDRARLPSMTFDNLNTGGRYNPITDTWTETSTNGAAEARNQHSAVWTGSRMLVWGGNGGNSNASQILNNGGSYDPTNDTWSAISTNNAPAARRNHTAVWSGDRMIVWGGDVGAGSGFNSGGTYDPATDAWQPLPVSGAPDGRYNHTAVWTGYEMLVWGGSSASGYQSNVARYVPSAELWNARPGVQLTAPANGAVFILPPLVNVSAATIDSDGTVTNVAFFVDGNAIGSDTTAPFTADWIAPGLGNHTVTAVAMDDAGLSTTSMVAQVSIWLINAAPTVGLAAPSDGTKIVVNGFVEVTATPNDPEGFVSAVEFRDGLSVIATLNAPPWTLLWTYVSLGLHELTAVATDNLGISTTSAVVTVEAVLVPRLEVFRDPDAWRLELTGGETGRVYRIDLSTNVVDWNPWLTNLATNGSFTASDTNLTGGQRFYRAVP